jgi:UDP-GlcNAc:undecaprenyl-phosphate GlcNAc-1-phosphate transferase
VDESLRIIAAFTTGLAITCLAVPLAERLAARTNFYDRPGGYKEHHRPTPYLGGVAVILGFLVASITFADALADFRVPALCALALLVVGTIDDRVGLGIAPRLVLEVGVAVAVWAAGQGWHLGSSEMLDLLVTIGWVVGLINAYNLMDNLDGATATVAGTSAVGIGALASVQGDPMLAATCFALAGACTGFLPHNLARPSKMFLGDGGSMPIGFILAAAVMVVPHGNPGLPALALGCLVVGIPLLDMAAVIVSRRRRGVGVFVGGRDHMTHRLFRYLDSERSVSGVLAVSQGFLCLVAVVLCQSSSSTVIVGFSVVALSAAALGLASIEPIASGLQRVRQDDA